MKYCEACGAPLLEGFRFCVQCGATIGPDGGVSRADEPDAAASVSGMPAYIPERTAPTPAPAQPEPVPAAPVQPAAPSAPIPAAPPAPAGKPAGLLSFDGAFVALLLFCLPGIGLITGIIWALGGARNQSRKNLARAYLLLVLALALFFGGMALLVHLIAGEQMQQFFSLLRSWLSAQ